MPSSSPKKQRSGLYQAVRQRSRTLYWRISSIFLLLTFGSAAVYGLLITNAWSNLNHLHAQRVHWGLAEVLAEELRPYFVSEEKFKEAYRGLYRLSRINPAVDIYLLSENGGIRLALREAGLKPSIDTAPLKQFIESTEAPSSAILGDHPFDNRSERVVFSAAPIRLHDGPGYIYVVLEGTRSRSGMTMMEDNAAVSGALTLFLTALLFTAALGLFIFSRITRRFGGMTEVLHGFQGGDYTRRIPLEHEDEIAEHARAFNDMADTITDNIRRLEQTDKIRRELVASVSHDVLQPLQLMQSILETVQMKGRQLAEQELQRYLQQTMRSLNRLNKILEDLFELSTLDAREKQPQLEKFSVGTLAEDTFDRYREVMESHGLHGTLELAANLPNALADPDMISRALSNLLENAVRYTPRGGSIRLHVEPAAEKIRVSVSDTGIGITDADLPNIFESFYRAKDAEDRRIRGTGLGLAITKRLIEAHDGQLFVKSRLGEGTIIGFELNTADGREFAAR